MIKLAECIANCLIDYVKECDFHRGNFEGVLSAVTLSKCFRANLWENSPYLSKQISEIDVDDAVTLVENDKYSFEALLECDPRTVESVSIYSIMLLNLNNLF